MIYKNEDIKNIFNKKRPIIVVSDVHIGSPSFKSHGSFLLFLNYVESIKAQLILNGDIVDLWYKRVSEFTDVENEIVEKILSLAEKTNVVYVIGNHDYAVVYRNYDTGKIKLVYPSCIFYHKGETVYISHGHLEYGLINNTLLDLTVGRLFTYVFSRLYNSRFLHRTYNKILKALTNKNGKNMINERFHYYATEHPEYDILIFSHTHNTENIDLEDNTVINTGSWANGSTDYLILNPGKAPKLESYAEI